MGDTIILERNRELLHVILNRGKANAIDLTFAEELGGLFERLENEAADLGAVVLSGHEGLFSAGLDLKALPGYSVDEQDRMLHALNDLLLRLYRFPRPVVAAVEGHAMAGGLILLLACDYRVGPADGDYRFGLTEAKVGVAFPAGADAVVQNELGRAVARRFMLTGSVVDAAAAREAGVFDELCPNHRVLPRARTVAAELGELPRASYAAIKRQVRTVALERMERAVRDGEEPLLGGWLNPETTSAADRLMGK